MFGGHSFGTSYFGQGPAGEATITALEVLAFDAISTADVNLQTLTTFIYLVIAHLEAGAPRPMLRGTLSQEQTGYWSIITGGVGGTVTED